MRAACVLTFLLLLAGCAGRQLPRPATNDPLLPGPPMPEKGTAGTDSDTFAPKVPPPPPTGDGKASPASLTAPSGTSSGVTLGNPRAAIPKAAAVTPTNFSAPAGALTCGRLQARLKARGVDWQRLSHQGGDSWTFVCAVPDPRNPGLRENYEVTRDGPGGLAAMQAVLGEIDQRRAR